ncbi:hypothetical protein REPUB_Repub15cG0025100 [Reevesia pubescens]
MSDLTELFTWTCARCDGLTKGFEVIELVVDIQNCLQAFVGVAKDLNAIVIAFRGTQGHNIQNWVEDLFWKELDLNYPGMPDAMVHHGFYTAYHNTTIRPGILYAVNHEAKNVQVITFGQPRIGNAAFASYYGKLVPNTIRVWLYNLGLGSLVDSVEKVCDGSGEDPDCSRSVTGNSIADHLNYYGVDLMCQQWRSCRIVMNPRVAEYGKTDHKGNLILSRDPATLVLKRNTRSNDGGVTSTA